MTARKADQEFEALGKRLGQAPPESLRELTAAQLADLTSAITDVRRAQAEELAAAGERALGHIPRLLRGPVRRVVG